MRDGGVKVLLGEFAFPDGDDGPGEGVEALGIEFVAGDIAGDFLAPECFVGLGNGVLGATAVAVPETAVDEDDGAVKSGMTTGESRSGRDPSEARATTGGSE